MSSEASDLGGSRSRDRSGRQVPQQRLAGHEEVAAAEHAHELGQAAQTDRAVARRDGVAVVDRLAARVVMAADDRIALPHHAAERRRLQPRLLDELELPLDVRVQTHEEQTLIAARLRLVAAADAQDAMAIGDRQLILRPRIEALARVGAPDVRAERTADAL